MTRLLAFLAALLLSACDFIYGVSRTATVTHVPDMDCLRARIMTYPEVKKVVLEKRDGGRPITLTGVKAPDKLWYLNYRGKNVFASILFAKDYKGAVNYSQSLIRMNARPPQSEIDATWPIMLRVERDLDRHFGFSELRSQAQTAVNGVTLPE